MHCLLSLSVAGLLCLTIARLPYVANILLKQFFLDFNKILITSDEFPLHIGCEASCMCMLNV